MGKIAIIQPVRIGDILICLPIARYFVKKGDQVIWPIAKSYSNMFSGAVDYVKFYPIEHDFQTCVTESLEIAKKEGCMTVINLAFGFPTMWDLWKKWKNSGKHFDEYKYEIAGVPFEEKWNLVINRNKDREEDLFKKMNVSNPYLVYQINSSDSKINITWKDDEASLDKIEVTPVTDNIFDWILTLEKANKFVLIDSCFVNLVDQLGINVRKRRIRKPLYDMDQYYPILKGKWEGE